MDEIQNSFTSRKVIASEISDNCLILEDPDTGQKIQWPLNSIPRPLNLGNELNLVLQYSDSHNADPHPKGSLNKSEDNTSEKQTAKEDLMRRMLEDLVN